MKYQETINQMIAKGRRVIPYILPLFFVSVMLLISYTNYSCYRNNLNADIAAEGILGRVIGREHQIIPDTWIPSTELRVLGTPNFAGMIYFISHDMNLSIQISCIIYALLIGIGIVALMKELNGSYMEGLFVASLMLLVPPTLEIAGLLYLFAGYYSIHTLMMLLMLVLWLRLKKAIGNRMIFSVGILISFVFSFLLGMQGARGLLIIFIPLWAVELLFLLFQIRQQMKQNKEAIGVGIRKIITVYKKELIWMTLSTCLYFVGERMPCCVHTEMSRNIRNGFSKLISVVFPHMLEAVGFGEMNPVSRILLVMIFLIGLKQAVSFWISLAKCQRADEGMWIQTFLFLAPLLTGFAVAFTTVESSARYYFLWNFWIVFVIYEEMRQAKNKSDAVRAFSVKTLAGGLIIIFCLLNAFSMYHTVYSRESKADEEAVLSCLKENHVFLGYATFEHANVFTSLSNGEITVSSVDTMSDMRVCKWLTDKAYYPPFLEVNNCTKTMAYIVTDSELADFEEFNQQHDCLRETDVFGKYHVFVTNSSYVYWEE